MAGTNGVGRFGVRSYVAPVSLSTIITNGLVLNLDAGNALSYSGTGTTWTDLSGNGNNGTLVNGTSYSSSNGGVLAFDGVNDYVSVNTPSSINLNNDMTIDLWVKFVSTGGNHRLIEIQDSLYSIQILIDGSSHRLATKHSKWETGYSNKFWSTPIINTWYNIVCVFTPTTNTTVFYQNGVQLSSSDGGNVGIGNQANKITLGVRNDFNGTTYLNGHMPIVRVYNGALTSAEVATNFNSTKERFGYPSYTARTSAFATATGITDTTILNALNTFDTGLISNGLDTKMKALYPFVGGTASTHKYNFMDARDLDAAYRLAFNGGWVHSSTGAKPNGTNAYADTFLQPSISLSLNSTHISYYSRTNRALTYGVPIGSYDNSPGNQLILFARSTSNTMFSRINTGIYNGDTYSVTDSRGFFIASRTLSSYSVLFRNGISLGNGSVPSNGLTTTKVSIGALKLPGGQDYYDNEELSISSIGYGLTDGESSTFYSLVQAFQTSLSRQV